MSEQIEEIQYELKYYRRKAKFLQEDVDNLKVEIARLKEENEMLRNENVEMTILRQENKELENKYLSMFIENGKLVETFDLLHQVMVNAVKK